MESRIKVGLNRGYIHAMCTYAQGPDMHEQCVDLKCKKTLLYWTRAKWYVIA